MQETLSAARGKKKALALASYVLGWMLGTLSVAQTARAWGPDGHHTVGAIADELIKGTHAASEVQGLLGSVSLQEASVWADCAKGVDTQTFTYKNPGQYPECAVFETPEGEAEMVDFVKRNSSNCTIKPGEEVCHKQYHYSDISVRHNHYDAGFVGARDDDILRAVMAASEVLRGHPTPAPFDFLNKREALLVLAHYVGDLHQPLHVGAIYLNAQGKRVNPDSGTFNPSTATRGGNQIQVSGSGKNLHATWDAISSSLTASHVSTLLTKAQAVPATTGPSEDWPEAWASESVAQAKSAFKGLKFDPSQSGHWTVTLPSTYDPDAVKETQLTRAGARLAALLETIWP